MRDSRPSRSDETSSVSLFQRKERLAKMPSGADRHTEVKRLGTATRAAAHATMRARIGASGNQPLFLLEPVLEEPLDGIKGLRLVGPVGDDLQRECCRSPPG